MMKNKTAKLTIIPATAALAGAAFMVTPASASETHEAHNASSGTPVSSVEHNAQFQDNGQKLLTRITDLLGLEKVNVLNGGVVNTDGPLLSTGDIASGDNLNGNGSGNSAPIASGNGDILSGNDTPVASGNETTAPIASGNEVTAPVEAPVASGNEIVTEAPVASGNDTSVEAPVEVPVEAPVASGNEGSASVDGNSSATEVSNNSLGNIGATVKDTVDGTLSGLDGLLR